MDNSKKPKVQVPSKKSCSEVKCNKKSNRIYIQDSGIGVNPGPNNTKPPFPKGK